VIENMVARDGVEPPTPAFSGLYPTDANLLNQFNLTLLFLAFSPKILDSLPANAGTKTQRELSYPRIFS
jgi:hypothetical protein